MFKPRNGLMADLIKMENIFSVLSDHISKRLAKKVVDYRHKVRPQAEGEEDVDPRVVCTIDGELVIWRFYG